MGASGHDDRHPALDHHAGGHDAYDGEPATDLGPGEPRTPLWVPGIGASLFVLAAIVLVARGGADAAPAKPAVAPAATAAPTAAPMQPARPAPPTGSANPRPPLSPEQAREVQRKFDELRRQRAAGTAAPATPPPSR